MRRNGFTCMFASLCASLMPSICGRSPTGILIPVTGGRHCFVVDSAGQAFRNNGAQ